MNDSGNPYDTVIADLRTKRDQIDALIQMLEVFRNWAPPPIGGAPMESSLFSQVTGLPRPTGPTGPVGPVGPIGPGTFHGMSIEVATKTLLQMRKRALGVQEIVSDLRSGGLHLQSETPANTVTSVLTRAFKGGGDIVRVSRGMWGLQEWYPNQRFNRGDED